MTLTIEPAMSRKNCLGEELMREQILIKRCYLKFRVTKEVKREASTPVLSLTSDRIINMMEVRTLATWVVRRTAKSSSPRKLPQTSTTKTSFRRNRSSRMPKTKINRLERAKKVLLKRILTSLLSVRIGLAKIRERHLELRKRGSLLLIARRRSELAKRPVMDKIFEIAKIFLGLSKSSPIRVN